MAAGCWQTPRPMTQPGGPTLPRRLGVGRLDSVPSMACSCPDWVWVPREGRDWGQELARLPEAMHVGSLVTVPHKRPALHGTERPRCWPSPGPRREQLPSPQPPALPRTSGFLGRQSYENVGSPTVPGLHRDVPALGGGESGPHHGPRGAPAVRSATPTPSWDSAGHPWSPCRLPRSTGQQQLFLHWTLCTRAGQPLKTCRTCHSDGCVCLKSPSRKPHGLNPERLPSSVGGQGAGGGMPRAGPPELCPTPCPEQTVSALNPAFGTGRAPCWPQSR